MSVISGLILEKIYELFTGTNKTVSSKGGAYRLNFPFFHLVKEMYGEKVGQKRMDNDFKMATVDGREMKV